MELDARCVDAAIAGRAVAEAYQAADADSAARQDNTAAAAAAAAATVTATATACVAPSIPAA
ncbi:hypothetical protein, partial [Hyphomonas sp.]|uniref:hypothetical protein n=1 Tax=Hyphomonas sp. TaxID=87 RepID=UPI0032975384